eukprot:TRINITY_DN1437_c0_g1_i1.p1 TRINITY_DN1437_c0_g1~~TRINITY_DN1437_c0_g1_i1.p1  ORF type:complete len:314 (+),score=77.64 TRINITY_DN1437_c0_g1_i1:35-976(+)
MTKSVIISAILILSALCSVNAYLELNKIYSAWYCGDDSCLWASQPDYTSQSWLLNRGDGSPTVNAVIFCFIDPLQLVKGEDGIPAGFTQEVVDYFTSSGIYVIFSIGGESYSSNWDQALAQNPTGLAQNAAAVALKYGVGIEIDYETDSSQSMSALTTFVKEYRNIIPYNSSLTPSPESILTVDLGAGTGYLSAISLTSASWLQQDLVNWANAMVAGDPNGDNTQYWQQHLSGSSWNNIPPMNGSQLVGSLYASSGASDCPNYSGTPLPNSIQWIEQNNCRGLSFWAVGCPAGPNGCVTSCPGIQQGSLNFLA